MKRTVLLAILALILVVAFVTLGALAISRLFPPACTPGTIGCAPGLVSTLKAMPTGTPEPTETPGPTPTSCGGLCWPTPEPTLDGPHMIYPHPHPESSMRSVEPGQLRPWRPGYPYDVGA